MGADSMTSFTLRVLLAAVLLLGGMIVSMEVGRRIALRRRSVDPEGALSGTGAMDGAVFAMLGLLLAFTFSGAASRFDARRQLIIEETNAIGTAYLRVDLLPSRDQPPVRDLFRRYVDSRIETYRKLPDIVAAMAEIDRSRELQHEIWSRAVAGSRAEDSAPSTPILLLPALNQMIDITTTRTMSAEMHPPKVIFAMLLALSLISALLAGYAMAARKARSWIHMLGFAAATVSAVYVVFDLEYPRLGWIRVDAFDRALVELRSSMD